MKILFVVPRTKSMYGTTNTPPGHPHVGIAYLTSYLKSKNVKVDIFDDGIEFSYPRLARFMKRSRPDLIGITMFSYCYQNAIDLIGFIKSKTKVPIVVGGPHVSGTKKQIMEETDVEFAIKQEGEKPLLSLLKYVVTGKPKIKNIANLIWRKKDGKIVENRDLKFLTAKELDRLPLPDYEAFGIKKYQCHGLKTIPLLTSRGCPFDCNYCSVKLSHGRNFRARSPENVFAEIKHWYDKGWRVFEINDDCFTTNMKRADAICDLIIQSGIRIQFKLYNGIRVDTVSFDLLRKMQQAGCSFLAFGCESGNDRILKKINKGITKAQVMRASRWCQKLGIKHSINFIIGHTGETYKTAMDSIVFAKKLPADAVNFYNLVPYPGTDAYSWVENHGQFLVSKENYLKHISYRDNTPIFETQKFTRKERLKITQIGFNLYESRTMLFRFGPILGSAIYYATRIPYVHNLAVKVFGSNLGSKVVVFLSQKSRQQ